MPFIVRVTHKTTGNVAWLTTADARGFHTLATLKMAATVTRVSDAESAIGHTWQAFLTVDLVFVIQ